MNLYYRLVLANYCLVIFLQSNTKPHTFNSATRSSVYGELLFVFTAMLWLILWLIAKAGYRFHEMIVVWGTPFLIYSIWAIVTPSYKTYEEKMKNAGVFSEYDKLSFKQRLGYACVAGMIGLGSFVMLVVVGKLFLHGYANLNQMPGRFGK